MIRVGRVGMIHFRFIINFKNTIFVFLMRIKNRYLLCELQFENDEIVEGLAGFALLKAINEELHLIFGDMAGVVSKSIQVKYYSFHTGLAIVKVAREYLRECWSAITLMTALRNRKCAMRVLHVGGTIQLVQKEAIRHNHVVIADLKKEFNVIFTAEKAALLEDEAKADLMQLCP